MVGMARTCKIESPPVMAEQERIARLARQIGEDIRKERRLQERKKAKNARPSKKGKR